MPSVSRSAEVAAPAQHVFVYLRDGEHVGDWLPDVVRSERLTPGPVAAGSRFLYVFRVLGRDFEVVNEVDVLEPPVRVGFRGVTGVASVRNQGEFVVAPLNGGARSKVTFSFSFDLPGGAIGAIARRLPVEAIVDRYAKTALCNLVHRLEAPTGAAGADGPARPG